MRHRYEPNHFVGGRPTESRVVPEPSTCQYKDFQESFFPYIDRITHSFSLTDCQRQCDAERLFPCRSINYETFARDCALSSEDMVTLGMGPNSIVQRRNSLFSEKGNCEQGELAEEPLTQCSLIDIHLFSSSVSVQCNQQDMVLTLNFDSPFNGRVYAKGSPSQCFVVGTGQTQLQVILHFDPKLTNTSASSSSRYLWEVVAGLDKRYTNSDCSVLVLSGLCSQGFEQLRQRSDRSTARRHYDRQRPNHSSLVLFRNQ